MSEYSIVATFSKGRHYLLYKSPKAVADSFRAAEFDQLRIKDSDLHPPPPLLLQLGIYILPHHLTWCKKNNPLFLYSHTHIRKDQHVMNGSRGERTIIHTSYDHQNTAPLPSYSLLSLGLPSFLPLFNQPSERTNYTILRLPRRPFPVFFWFKLEERERE